ncbi:MAG: hypothetical protein ACKVZH_14320 [Blastocatellia bacterium]
MRRFRVYFSIEILLSITLIFFVLTSNSASNGLLFDTSDSFEGIYELVSQEIDITGPQKASYSLAPPKWGGLWLFQGGYFSSVLMKEERERFFECKDQNLGYESFAGIYTLEDNKILFKQSFSLHPYYKNRPVIMNYQIKSNTLTLTQVLRPTVEDKTEGTVKVILRKLPKRDK